MTDDRPPGEVPLTTTYAVAGAEPAEAGPAPPPPSDEPRIYVQERERGGLSRKHLIAGGVAGAVGLGLLFGLVLGPKLDKPATPQIERIAPAGSEAPRLQIEVTTRQAPEPKVASRGRLDAAGTVVEPTPAARTAERNDGGLFGALGRMLGGDDRGQASAEPVQRVERVREPEPRPQPAPAIVPAETDERRAVAPGGETSRWRAWRAATPSFDCRFARTRAELMVCEDPRLAAADRRLAAAYRRAMDSGVPSGRLRRQQDRWLAARERAAVSPEAVHMVYQQRIAELESLDAETW